ncbi:MAG: hypothetical protein COA79_00515 [Planctomycetota bacterium]|nr:MAG: hypothetical protein COA79_00515 [Planctomycetota bacterium]
MSFKPIFLISILLFQRQKLSLIYASLSLLMGVLSVFVVIETIEVLKSSIYQNGQKIFAADLSISSYRTLNDLEQKLINDVLKNQMNKCDTIEFPSMIKPDKGSSMLASIKGIDHKYPLYGRVKLKDNNKFNKIQRGNCLIDYELSVQSRCNIGDFIQVGSKRFQVVGIITELPEQEMSGGFNMAPKILINIFDVDDTGLIQFGSRIKYKSFYSYKYFPDNIESDIKTKSLLLKEKITDPGINVKTFKESEEFTKEILNQITVFFMLSAYFVLILSLAGFGSSLYTFLTDQLKDIATLRCLGFHKSEVLITFLFLYFIIGLVSGFIGIIFGKAISILIISWLENLLSINMAAAPLSYKAFEAVGFSIALSLWVGFFGIYIFSKINGIDVFQQKLKNIKLPLFVQLLITTGCLFIFWIYLWWNTDEKLNSFYIIFGLAILMAVSIILIKIIWLLLILIYKIFPRSFHLDLALLELRRNQNKYLVFLLTLGLGSSALLALYFVESAFDKKLSLEIEKKQPNLFFIGIQKNQVKEITKRVRESSKGKFYLSPLIQARLKSINGTSIESIIVDLPNRSRKRRLLSRNFRLTYQNKLAESEKIVKGEFWRDGSSESEISLELDFAKVTNIKIGDILNFNIQGKEILGTVTSLRKVNWGTMQPNFFVMMPTHILEDAPQFTIGSVYIENEDSYLKLKNDIYKIASNVTIINISHILSKVLNLFSYLGIALKSLFLLCMLLGICILMGSLNRTQKEQDDRKKILQALGWHSKNIWIVEMLESLIVGFILSVLVTAFVIPILWSLQNLLKMDISASVIQLGLSFILLLFVPFIGQEFFRLSQGIRRI